MPVITLDEAKVHLNITGSTHDAELMGFIESAEGVIAKRCGPLGPTTKSVRVRGTSRGTGTGTYQRPSLTDRTSLILPVCPAVSLTSVTPVGGTALTLADLYLSPNSVVTFNLGGSFGDASYDVVYVSGRATVPADLMHAVKELVKHLWVNSQRGGSGARKPGSDAPASSAAYLMPYAVQSLIEPYMQPGFA